ncbi:MAG: gliding motility-associated C-terminal domain-containing protein [Saprospiraceae bacterium]|nr:gliding motility-associated C-terminal domain-containing protein [Saprospiraceae bacterium]
MKLGIFIAIGLLFNIQNIQSTHIVGGDLTYRHVSGDVYEVTLSLRRDCFLGHPDAEFDPIAHIGIFSANGSQLINFGNNGHLQIPYIGNDTLNPFIRSDCGFEGRQVCVQEAKYVGYLILPFRFGGYILGYQRCCRNATLNNIVDPLNTGATYWVAITDTALSEKNSSPTFKEWADVYICANKPLVFDHSAIDPEGDSLVYSLCLPNKGGSQQIPNPPLYNTTISPPPFPFITWATPYSLNNMMGGVALKIDKNTGILTATPNLEGQYLIGVCVSEFRNGVKISEIHRDFQYNVRICSQPPKAIFETPAETCNGLQVPFTNNSLSAGSYKWYFNWPSQDPAFFSTEVNPVFTYPSSGEYNVKLRVIRGTDGCFDSIIKPIKVFENTILPEFTFRLDECDVTQQTLKLLLTDQSTYNQPGYGITERIWRVVQNSDTTFYSGNIVQAQVSYTGEIKVSLEIVTSSDCRKTIEKTIDPNVIIPKTEFTYALENCPQNGITSLRLTDVSIPLNPFATIGNISWNVNGNTYTGSNILVPLSVQTGNVNIKQSVGFISSCTIDKERSFNLQDLLPKANYSFKALGCDDEQTVNVEFTYENQEALGYALTNGAWSITTNNTTQNVSGTVVQVTVPNNKEITVLFVATFSNGCTDTIFDSFTPGPFPTLEFTNSSHILCPNQEKALLLNGNANWTYIWSPEEGLDLSDPANPKVIGITDTTYSVTVTDGICTATGSVAIQVLGAGVILSITGNPNTCDGTTELVVTGGIGQGEYMWSENQNMLPIIFTGDTLRTQFTGNSKTYYAQFVGESCSTMPASFTVTNQTPSVLTSSPYNICPGDSVFISVFNEIPLHNLLFEWDAHPFIIGSLNQNQIKVKVDAAQSTPFSLFFETTNQFGCKLRDSILFTIGNNPVADYTFDLKECGKYEVCFKYNGTHTGFIQWDFGDPNSSTDVSSLNEPCYTYPGPGTYLVTLKNLTSICGFKPVTKEIILNPKLEINPIPTSYICEETEMTFNANANIEDVDFSWCTIDGKVISNDKTIKITVSKDTSFILKAKDIYGCVASDTFDIEMFTFNYSLDIPETSCRNLESVVSIDIANPELYTFQWLPLDCITNGSSSISPSIIAIKDKVYKVIVTHTEKGCRDEKEFTLDIPDPLKAAFESSDIFCYNEEGAISVLVTGGSVYNYAWSPVANLISGQNTPNPVFSFTNALEVQVIVEDLTTKCKDTFLFSPVVNPPVEIDVNAIPDVTVYEGKDIEIIIENPDPDADYVWSTGQNGTSIIVSPTDNTTYIVTVTDENGCTATDQIEVEVRKAKCDESDIFIPNAFSPNGDNNNPVLYVRSNFIEELDFIIYNRWGQEVFKTNDPNKGWDGTFNGELLSPDAFAYFIKAKCINGTVYQKAGNVSLMR